MKPPSLDQIIHQLQSGDLKQQVAAHDELMGLAKQPDYRQALIEALAPLVGHPQPEVRGTALLGLAAAQGAESVALLLRHVDDSELSVRSGLVHAAEEIGEAARAILLRLVEDQDFTVRFQAAAALAQMRDATGMSSLLEGLKFGNTRLTALNALMEVGDQRAFKPVQQCFHKFFVSGFVQTMAAGVLTKLGDEQAKSWLVGCIQRPKKDNRSLAIALAGELQLPEAAKILEPILRDPRDSCRGAAAVALAAINNQDTSLAEELAKLLEDETQDTDLRLDAVDGLARMKITLARQILERALNQVRQEEIVAALKDALNE